MAMGLDKMMQNKAGGLLAAGQPMQQQQSQAEAQALFSDGGRQAASPEEQSLYDEYVDNAKQLLYGQDNFEGVVNTITNAPDPVEGIAIVAANTTKVLRDSMEQNGVQPDPDIQEQAGVEIVEMLVSDLNENGILNMDDDQTTNAFIRAVDIYREMEQGEGRINPEEAQANLQVIQQADQTGQLGQLIPELNSGLDQWIGKGAQNG